MALQNETSRIQYNGNNSTATSYAVPFYFFDNAHIKAIVTNSSGVDSPLSLGSGFTLTGAGNVTGGTLTTTAAVPSSSTLTIYREVPATQLTSYAEGGDFPAASHERALDKLTMLCQQLFRSFSRTLRFSETATGVASDLPNPQANHVIGWTSAATGFQNYDFGRVATLEQTTAGLQSTIDNKVPNVPSVSGAYTLATSGSGTPASWQPVGTNTITNAILASGSNTPRFLSDRFAEVLNAKDWGLKGDGVTDDAPALRTLFAHAWNSKNATIVFPKGRYRLASPVNLPSGDTISGNTWNSVRGGYIYFVAAINNDPNNQPKIRMVGDEAVFESSLWSPNVFHSGGIKLWVQFTGGGGTGAEGYATWDGAGRINNVVITNNGTGYTSAPSVSFHPTKNTTPTGGSNIVGSGASFGTPVVFGGQVTSVPIAAQGSGYALNSATITWFILYGYYSLTVENISFVNRFGGIGERPISGDFTGETTALSNNTSGYSGLFNGNYYLSQSGSKCFRTDGPTTAPSAATYPTLSKQAGDIEFHKCKFYDFTLAVDITFHKLARIHNCFYSAKYGMASAGGRIDWSGFVGTRYGIRSVEFINNEVYLCEADDLTAIVSQHGRANYMGFYGCDNACLPSANGFLDSLLIAGNKVYRNAYEGLGPAQGVDIEGTFGQPDTPANVVFTDNIVDGTMPKGAHGFFGGANYGIVVDSCPAAKITNNYIRNCFSGMIVGASHYGNFGPEQAAYSDISNNTIVFDMETPRASNGGWIFTGAGAISIGTTSNRNNIPYRESQLLALKNNCFVFDVYPSFKWNGVGQNWNGSSSSWTTEKASVTPHLIGLGNALSRVLASNNVLLCNKKEDPNDFSVACSGVGNGFFDNNTMQGFDFACMTFGGVGLGYIGTKNYYGKTLIRPMTAGGPMFHEKEQLYVLYPTQIGWYRIEIAGRGAWRGRFDIWTAVEDRYGDTTQFWSNMQSTALECSFTGYLANATNVCTINQIAHATNSDISPVISQYAFRMGNEVTNHAFYVNTILTRLKLKFTGGGGSGAAGYVNVVNGVIQSPAVITAGGSGYTSNPTVEIDTYVEYEQQRMRLAGKGVVFGAITRSGNAITGLTVSNGGSGYASPIYINYTDLQHEMEGLFNSAPLLQIYVDPSFDFNDSSFKKLTFTRGQKAVTQIGSGQQLLGSGTPILGTSAPAIVPEYIGQEFIDATNQKTYKAFATNSTSDWMALN